MEPRLAVDSWDFIWVAAGEGILKHEPIRGDAVWTTQFVLPSGRPLALVTDRARNCFVAGDRVGVTKLDEFGNLHWTDGVTNAPWLGTTPVAALCVSTNGLVVGSWRLWEGAATVVALQETNVAGLPEITLQPFPDLLHVTVSNQVSYTVAATGAEPLRYQWKIRGPGWAPWLATATNATCYPDTDWRSSNAVAVMIWNDVGYILSRPITLDVGFAPAGAINTPLGSRWGPASSASPLPDSLFSTVLGATQILLAPGAHFPIQGEDGLTATFQWFFNGAPIAGATNDYLILPDMSEDESGTYSLQIENLYGSHSTDAQVHVAQNVRQEFVQHPEHPGWANPGRRIVTGALGNYYVSSLTNALELGKLDWIVSKYHRFGFLLRTVHVAKLDRDGSSYYHDFATTGDGRLAAVYSEAGTNSAYRCGTRQYDPDGILVWEAWYSDTNGFACEPRELRIDPLGNSYVRIEVRSSPGSQVLAKYDRTGGLVYAGFFDLPFTETGELLAIDAQGQAVLATRGGLFKLGPTGEVLWRSDRNACVCAKTDPAGHVFVSDRGNRVVAKLDAQGQVLWTSGEYGYLEPDRAGNLYAWELQSPDFRTYRLLKLDGTTGRVLWGRSGFDEAGNYPRQLALDPADNLYLLSSHPLGNGVSWLCKMDSQGNLLWSATYGLDGNCRFESAQLCLGAAGDLHVVGMSDGNSAPEGSCPDGWVIVKYSQADDASAPGIVANPVDQMVLPGEAVTFTVSAVGAPDLRCQWWQASTPGWIGAWPPLPLLAFPPCGLVLRGETNATLNVTNAGIYFVEVSNPLGVTSSRGVSLTHEPPPWLSAQALAGGQYRFELYGQPDRTYEIQLSLNLQHWSRFTDLVTTTNGWIKVTNAVDPDAPARFFRAVRRPR